MNTSIMFTDIVGYSKLTGDDQNLALELLKEHDKLIEPIIERYEGEIVKRIGDAIVAIFKNSANMIQSSVEIQQSLKNRNNRSIQSRHITLRIGLHHGEVIIKNDEVYGLGYELASSIEPICEYGGIALSHDLYNQTHENEELILNGANNHFFIRPIAEFNFKSITKPMMIYKLYLNLLDWYDEPKDMVCNYLVKQNISNDLYKVPKFDDKLSSETNHHELADNFFKQHNLSYAVYHYKMYLDYYLNDNQESTELNILYIFSTLGLGRLVNRVCKIIKSQYNLSANADLFFINAITYFNQKEFGKAAIDFENALSKKENQFLFEACYYLLVIFYFNSEYKKGIDLIAYYKKQISSHKLHSVIFDSLNSIFLNSQKNHKDNYELTINITAILDNIELIGDKKFILFLYWFLIQFYKQHKNTKQALYFQDKAHILINELANAISGFQLKNLFLDKPLIHQMLMEEIDFDFIDDLGLDDFSEPEQIKTTEIDVFNFCTECGFKNDNKFQFCPSCGNKLTK